MGWTSSAALPILALGLVFVWIKTFAIKGFQLKYICTVFFSLFIATLIYLIENWIERGHPLLNGYEDKHFLVDLFKVNLLNYWGTIGSQGRGLFWFLPTGFISILVAYIHFSVKDKFFYNLTIFFSTGLVMIIGFILLYGSFGGGFGGGGYWGPRYMMFPSLVSAFILGIIIFNWKNLYLAEKIILSISGGLQFYVMRFGIALGQRYHGLCQKSQMDCHYTWYESPFYLFLQPWNEWLIFFFHRSNLVMFLCFIMICSTYYIKKLFNED